MLKLFLNIHKQGAPRLGPAEKDYLTSGMTIDSVAVNGQPVPWTNDPATFTVAALPLPQPLAQQTLWAEPPRFARSPRTWAMEVSHERH